MRSSCRAVTNSQLWVYNAPIFFFDNSYLVGVEWTYEGHIAQFTTRQGVHAD